MYDTGAVFHKPVENPLTTCCDTWIPELGRSLFGRVDFLIPLDPTDGSANAEVVSLVAKALGVAKGQVRIASGETARLKRLEIPFSEAEARQRLPG